MLRIGLDGTTFCEWLLEIRSVYGAWTDNRHHALSLLGASAPAKGSSVVLLPPASTTNPVTTQALWAQMAFEKLSLPAFALLNASLAALFALGSTSGVVLHIGATSSTASVIIDSIQRTECSAVADVGKVHCEEHLVNLLLSDTALDKELRTAAGKGDEPWGEKEKERYVRELGEVIWTECTGEDIEVIPASGSSASVAATQVEEDNSFDVAKK